LFLALRRGRRDSRRKPGRLLPNSVFDVFDEQLKMGEGDFDPGRIQSLIAGFHDLVEYGFLILIIVDPNPVQHSDAQGD